VRGAKEANRDNNTNTNTISSIHKVYRERRRRNQDLINHWALNEAVAEQTLVPR